MNYIKDIPLKKKDNYNIIVEIERGTKNKTELQEPLFNNLILATKVSKKYPYYYGCFPQTLAGDKDPLDIILLTNKKRNLLDIVEVEIVGMLITNDNGEEDNKILVKEKQEDIKNIAKLVYNAYCFLDKVIAKNSRTKLDKTIYSKEDAIKVIEYSHKNYLENKKQEFKVLL